MDTVTTKPSRRAREKAALRAQILDAARQLFAKEGYEAVTMREVARKIQYTATALYYHFPDKESLLTPSSGSGRWAWPTSSSGWSFASTIG
jgi:DNA-binding transcriptional regulator YbjK